MTHFDEIVMHHAPQTTAMRRAFTIDLTTLKMNVAGSFTGVTNGGLVGGPARPSRLTRRVISTSQK